MRTYSSCLLLFSALTLAGSCGDTTSVVTCEEIDCRPDQVCLQENPGFGIPETSCVTIGCDNGDECLQGEECVIPEQAALTQKLTLAPRAGLCKVPCEDDEACETECSTDGYCAAPDCRTEGCDAGESCEGCLTFEEGVEYICLPDGTIC